MRSAGLLNIPGLEEEEEMRTKQVTVPGKSRALAKYDGTKEDFESYVLTRLRKEGRTVSIVFWDKLLRNLNFPIRNADNNYREIYLRSLDDDKNILLRGLGDGDSRKRTVTYDSSGGIQLNHVYVEMEYVEMESDLTDSMRYVAGPNTQMGVVNWTNSLSLERSDETIEF